MISKFKYPDIIERKTPPTTVQKSNTQMSEL